jgi:glycosyltransferase involved in cell wall biosynthesis
MSAGLDHADGDAVVIIDADLQDLPELIPKWCGYGCRIHTVFGQRSERLGSFFWVKVYCKTLYKLTIGRFTIPKIQVIFVC